MNFIENSPFLYLVILNILIFFVFMKTFKAIFCKITCKTNVNDQFFKKNLKNSFCKKENKTKTRIN